MFPVVIIDYGMGNLPSVKRALEECGADALITDNPADLGTAEKIVLPGVGSFSEAMSNIRNRGWEEAILTAVHKDGVPLLGICLGMQLLAENGTEGGESRGLGLVPGSVVQLKPKSNERIPHVGWNEVHFKNSSILFQGIPDRTDFYFVHSYHFVPRELAAALATTPYCGGFVSVVGKGRVYGVQFHPEKSIPAGFTLLKNFLELG